MKAFARRKGGIVTSLDRAEAELLQSLSAQLIGMLEPLAGDDAAPLPGLVIGGSDAAPTDPALARLLPDAYLGDDEESRAAARDYRGLTESGLAGRKSANAAVVMSTATAGDIRLTEAEAQAWLHALTDLRLVIAERLGIEDEGSAIADDEEARTLAEVYDWLGWAQDSLVRAVDR
ncbi:DUF2017 domain-containing protein [Galbitalea sp. SE-J8]|uniref:DUF2017 domain-containing protein n=1 Tax=Galbitalea sp. SE-J8 TaxID=3054952 RepID=UPI00259CA88F|nr:DUF2017 domain-containing protein [Galbitalea sp. SE-J8]MDM4764364.1 DUF2017 domain-containing protein [Galbitalea sp. SE-J8]